MACYLYVISYIGVHKLSLSNNYKYVITKCHHRKLIHNSTNYLEQHSHTNFIIVFEKIEKCFLKV